eukprot:TRINITY_DN77173_c0_g1_i1.p1 TRINITY_DN77173_c0_g1~~TRINITY_DN77173_c0_g1_i1.p1  ORF type:complete len:337 (+),score=58.61 TRINITY_DN77173_c0_g1_i1:61-1071(+)
MCAARGSSQDLIAATVFTTGSDRLYHRRAVRTSGSFTAAFAGLVFVLACTAHLTTGCRWIVFLSPGRGRRSGLGVRGGCLPRLASQEDETTIWREAYVLETERAELLNFQLQTELRTLGEMSEALLSEFEGCLTELDDAPSKPESEEASKWCEAYQGLKRCNEQLELQISSIRARIFERESQTGPESRSLSVTMDLGPIKFRGIKFKDMKFDRYSRETGSSFYFVELPMPLGVQLEERTDDILGRVIEVTSLVDGGSAAADGTIRVGDILRAITTPRRQVKELEEGGNVERGGVDETKAAFTIPRDDYPFAEVMEQIGANKKLDSYAGLAFERPFK